MEPMGYQQQSTSKVNRHCDHVLASDMNVVHLQSRVEAARWVGASAVAARELTLVGDTRIAGSIGTRGRAVDASVLSENKEWKESGEKE